MVALHDHIRDKIVSACSGSQLFLICERKSLLHGNNSRPGDIFLHVWNACQLALLDVTVSSSLQPSFTASAVEKSGAALSAPEDRKYEQYAYAQKCGEVGVHFILLAFGSFGVFLETVRKTLKIASVADKRSLLPEVFL